MICLLGILTDRSFNLEIKVISSGFGFSESLPLMQSLDSLSMYQTMEACTFSSQIDFTIPEVDSSLTSLDIRCLGDEASALSHLQNMQG